MRLTHAIWSTPGIVLIATSSALAAAQGGALRGVVTDREFGTPISGVTITIVENGLRVATNEQGIYNFSDIAAGKYTLKIEKPGFVRRITQDVIVQEGRLTDIDADLAGEFEDMDEVVVQEIELAGSESSLLELRLESPQLLDSIGAEMMAKAGAGDAAAALLLVSGATVQDGKYAVVRGLPDRYVSAQLDGVRLPTADAERRAVQLDQFPTAVIQSVQVSKTFTPDQQGDASGGAVNIDLKDLPEETSFQIKGQANFNSQASFRDDFLTYKPGGGVDFWGRNSGRGIPTDLIGQSWPNPVGTSTGGAPTDYKWSASGGGKWEIDDGVKVGGFASLFYERDSSYFDNGRDDSWFVTPFEGLTPEYSRGSPSQGGFQTSMLDITEGSQSVQWGGLASAGIETPNHKVGATYLYTHLAENTAVLAENTRGKAYYTGPDFIPGNPEYDPNDPGAPGNNGDLFYYSPYQRLETLEYTEQTTSSMIFKGEHKLGASADSFGDGEPAPLFDWRVSFSEAVWDQPDKTQFGAQWLPESNDYTPGSPGLWLPLPPADSSSLGWAQHIWQKITEDSTQGAANLKLPFKSESGRDGYTKFGVFADQVERKYTQQTFSNENDPNAIYEGGFGDPWSGVFNEQDHPMVASNEDIDYDGNQRIGALYAMFDLPVGEQFNVIGGARIESTTLSTKVHGESGATWFPPGALVPISFGGDPTAADVDFSQEDILPSIGLQWQMVEHTVLRLNFAQTVARQTFRELTPIIQEEYAGGPIFIGNPDLQMSSLDNYDARVDYTPFTGWLFSGSVFYKSVDLPIEYAQFIAPQNFSYTTAVNYPSGWMLGLELEARVKMGDIDERLQGLSLGGNATFIRSQVRLPADEIDDFEQVGYPTETRAMTGTPEYLLNLNATYDFERLGTQLGLFYTVQGDTLVEGAGATQGNYIPDVYATPYGTLNFTLQQKLSEHWKCFFQAKNLLNPEIQTVYRSPYFPDVLHTSYTAGIDFAVGLSFQLDF